MTEPVPSVHAIRARLAALRRRIRLIFAVAGGARVIVTIVGALALFFLADWLLDLPLGVRRFIRLGLFDRPDALPAAAWLPALALVLFLAIALTRSKSGAAGFFAFLAGGAFGVVLWIAIRAFSPLGLALPDADLAISAEDRFVRLDDRLSAALDFEQELAAPSRGESPEMMRHVVDEAVNEVRQISVSGAASPRRAVNWVGAAAMAIGVAAIALFAMPDTIGLWFERSIELKDTPWPRATTMLAVTISADGTIAPHDPAQAYEVPLGRPLVIHARAEGDVPDEVFLVDLVEGQEPLARRMFSVPDMPGIFAYEFRDVRRPFAFLVRGGDDEDEIPRYRVEITIPPRVLGITSTITFPEYLGATEQTIESGNVIVPEGSTIDVAFATDVVVTEATLLMGDERRPVAALGDSGGRRFGFTFEATAPITYRLLLRTPEGRTNDASLDSYDVRVRRDRAPRIEWVYPRGTIKVTPEGRVPLLVRTSDDYAVTALALQMRTGGDEIVTFELAPAADETADSDDDAPVLYGNDGPYERKQVLTYVALDLPDLRTAADGKISAPGQLSFRFVAQDSLEQLREGDWTYVDVFGPAELERGLAGQRSNVRTAIAAVQAEQQTRRDELAEVLNGTIGDAEMDVIKTVRFSQGKIAQDADQAVRSLIEIFNAFIYDRMGAQSPNEKILGYLDRHHRATYGQPPAAGEPTPANEADGSDAWLGDPVFPYTLYEEIVMAWRDRVIYDRGLIDRMLAVLADGTHVGAHLAPAAHGAVAGALSGSPDDIRAAVEAQDRHLAALDRLLEAMQSWKSLSDVTQVVRRLIDEQRALSGEIEDS